MSERHIRRLAAQEADIFYNSSHEIMSHDVNNKCTTLITNDYTMKPTTTNIKHKMEIEYNENNETFVQNDDDMFRLSDMADLQDYPVNISCNESNNLGSENESINDFDLQDDLAVWAVKHQITHTALTALLYRLKKHSCFSKLPVDARSLLKTPRQQNIRVVMPGSYFHFGLLQPVKKIIASIKDNVNCVKIAINIDGLPLSKSSQQQF